MRLTVVGCAGSFPGPDSPASCYLLEVGAAERVWRVLLDAGSGAIGPLQRSVRLRDLDAVCLTHLHPDHCMDLCGLYVALRYDPAGRPERRLPVYGPAGTLARLTEAYGADGDGKLTDVFDVREWQDGVPVPFGPLTVQPFRVEHPVAAYGLRAAAGQQVVAYTGDTDTCPALLPLARNADVLLCEASFQEGRDTARGVHLTGQRAGELAAAAGVGRLVLTHIPPWNDPEVTLAEAKGAFDGSINLAHPGLVIEP